MLDDVTKICRLRNSRKFVRIDHRSTLTRPVRLFIYKRSMSIILTTVAFSGLSEAGFVDLTICFLNTSRTVEESRHRWRRFLVGSAVYNDILIGYLVANISKDLPDQ